MEEKNKPSEIESTLQIEDSRFSEDESDNTEENEGKQQKESSIRTTANSCSNNSLMYFQSNVSSQGSRFNNKK